MKPIVQVSFNKEYVVLEISGTAKLVVDQGSHKFRGGAETLVIPRNDDVGAKIGETILALEQQTKDSNLPSIT